MLFAYDGATTDNHVRLRESHILVKTDGTGITRYEPLYRPGSLDSHDTIN